MVDIQRLRGSTPSQQAAILRKAVECPEAASIVTDQLLTAIREERIPTSTIQIWLSIAQSPIATVAAVRQPHNGIVRQGAMLLLTAHIRRAESFAETWDALGGTDGIVDLLSELSVFDVRALLKCFRATAYSPIAREERQKRMVELFNLLSDPEKNPETRPLKVHYTSIIPACTQEMALQWTKHASDDSIPEWQSVLDSHPLVTKRLRRRVQKAHWDATEQQIFDKYFGPEDPSLCLDELKPFTVRSKKFGIKVVGVFTQSDTLRGFTAESVMKNVILETAKHCSRRRTPNDLDSQFWSGLLTCLQKHPSLASGDWMVSETTVKPWHGGLGSKSLLHYAAARWNHRQLSSQDDGSLGRLMGLIPDQLVKSLKLDDLLFAVSPGQRYNFLRLFYQHAGPYKFDIGPNGDSLAGVGFSATMFLSLSSFDAVALFERYRRGNTRYGSLILSRTSRKPVNFSLFMHDKNVDESLYPDGNALRAYILRRAWAKLDSSAHMDNPAPIFEDLRVNELDGRRKRSAQSDEPEARSCWAIAALCLCVAMGDYDAYANTWIWARRFNRDRVTLRAIYSCHLLQRNSGLDMLAVLPEAPVAIPDLEDKIQKANKILLLLVETAIMALREPSFKVSDWHLVLKLTGTVVTLRLRRCSKMQDFLRWSDEDMFDKVLRPSLDVLIDTEALLLKPEHKRLQTQAPHGLLQPVGRQDPLAWRPYVMQFLDTLAQRRNELWAKRRSQNNPSVITLEEPWPRGLPVQCLWHSLQEFCIEWEPSQDLFEHSKGAEYLQHRAQSVVFCDKDVMLMAPPAAREIQEAIGPFVDNWMYALRIYVGGADGKAKRQQRIDKALKHAMGPLTGDRMTPDEASRFWYDQFTQAGIKREEFSIASPNTREPARLPDPTSSRGPVEWDPDPEFQATEESPAGTKRIQGVTRLDCMLQAPTLNHRRWEWEVATRPEELTIPAETQQRSYWSMQWHNETGPPEAKGLVGWSSPCIGGDLVYSRMATAILCVNSTYGADTSLLMKPFPDEREPVFPAMYLDQDFLEREGKEGREAPARSALTASRHAIPPTLLTRLAASMLHRLRQEKSEERQRYDPFVQVLELAIYGASPSSALPLLRDFVVEFVDASAWHRILLNLGIVDRLNAREAEAFFVSLAKAITERLKQQKEQPPASEKPSTDKAPQLPLVKVTTVKMIAQLLRVGVFVRPGLAVDVLSQILRNASHVDIQIAAIEPLISASGDAALKPQIMDMLKRYAVPLASALNERKPETEADWVAAENGGELLSLDTKDRVLNMLIEKSTANESMHLELAGLAFQQSAENHTRWATLFLKKHDLRLDAGILPKIPLHPDMLRRKIDATKPAAVSLQDFNTMRNYVLFLLREPEALKEANKQVRENTELCRTNAGKHWLKMWDNGPFAGLAWGGPWAAGLLTEFAKLDREQEPTTVPYKMVEEFAYEIGTVLLDRGDLGGFDLFRQMLVIPYDQTHEDRGHAKIARLLIEHIDRLRTPEWQTNPNRQPSVLPRTLPLRLALIPLHPDMPEHGIAESADILIELLREVLTSRVPYFDQYREIERHVASKMVLTLALPLGSLSKMDNPQDPTPVDYLRAKLAAEIVEAQPQREEHPLTVLESLELMLREWRASPAEELRTLAEKLPHTLKPKEATSISNQ